MEHSSSDPAPKFRAGRSVKEISKLMILYALSVSSPALADHGNGAPNRLTLATSTPTAFVTVEHLGESEPETALRDGQLLSLRRKTDPFSVAIRGPFKGLPPTVEKPPTLPTLPPLKPVEAPSQVVSPISVPTLEKAIQELSIGAVNVPSREILVGPRSIREGDLLVLESGGRQFVVWLQSVSLGGVSFCDTDLQNHILKSFDTAPKELPDDSTRKLQFLNQDTTQ